MPDITRETTASLEYVTRQLKMMAGKGNAWQPTILAELGRIDDDEDMIEAARQLCELDPHPTVRNAVAMVRRWRTGTQPRADERQLAVAIASTIDKYVREHCDATQEILLQSLEIVRRAVAKMDY
jgi:hypothetical protein